jgi:N-acetyl-alpha-D-muramate 1-phosphate uridylyltransferase
MAPLTRLRPKALLPLGNVTLVDHAIARVRAVTGRIAVNRADGDEQMATHLSGRVHVSVDPAEGLGTAGPIANLASWVGDSDLLVVNGDTWCPGELTAVVDAWDHRRVRVVIAGDPDLTPSSRIVASLMPAQAVHRLRVEPSGLYEVCWAPLVERGELDVVGWDGPVIDCATPRDYLTANLLAARGQSVIGAGAVVDGAVVRTVVWPGARVWPGESLVDAVRTDEAMTVLVR